MDNVLIFPPKADTGLPFLALMALVVLLGGYGIVRSFNPAAPGRSVGLLLGVVAVAITVAGLVLQARARREPITVRADRVETSSWSISFERVRGVREDQVAATQYLGGRPVVGTQRRLLVDTDQGPQVIAYEATYDIAALGTALRQAWQDHGRQHP